MHVRYSESREYEKHRATFGNAIWKNSEFASMPNRPRHDPVPETIFLITFLDMIGWKNITILFGVIINELRSSSEYGPKYLSERFYKCSVHTQDADFSLLDLIKKELKCDIYRHGDQIIFFLLYSELSAIIQEKLTLIVDDSLRAELPWIMIWDCHPSSPLTHGGQEIKNDIADIRITPHTTYFTIRKFRKLIHTTTSTLTSIKESLITQLLDVTGMPKSLAEIIYNYHYEELKDKPITWEKTLRNPEGKEEEKRPSSNFPPKVLEQSKPLTNDAVTLDAMRKHARNLRSSVRSSPLHCFGCSSKWIKLTFLDYIIKLHDEGFELTLAVKKGIDLAKKEGTYDKIMSGWFSQEVKRLTDEILTPGSSQHKTPYFSDTEPRFRC